jgi:hypothetical protein
LASLPELSEFGNFTTEDENGFKIENINGKAVSIEMFLDLNYKMDKKPIVRWGTNINPKMNQKQGVLVDKDRYSKTFKELKTTEVGIYDTSKLKFLLSSLIDNILA